MLKLFKPVLALTLLVLSSSAFAADAPGVTPSEIKVGGVSVGATLKPAGLERATEVLPLSSGGGVEISQPCDQPAIYFKGALLLGPMAASGQYIHASKVGQGLLHHREGLAEH
jgi:hypothetical protein